MARKSVGVLRTNASCQENRKSPSVSKKYVMVKIILVSSTLVFPRALNVTALVTGHESINCLDNLQIFEKSEKNYYDWCLI